MPPFVPGNFGIGIYDVLSWGFSGGESKALLGLARKDVIDASREFKKNCTPAFIQALRKIFVEMEKDTQAGIASRLRLDIGLFDWYQVGVANARYLHATEDAQKAIEAVLSRYSGLFYEALGVELELRLVETALKAGALSESVQNAQSKRQDALTAQRDRLQQSMRSSIGREKDFSGIVTPEDERYLTALAKAAGDGFMTDARTKKWLAQRVDALIGIIEAQVKRKAALEALKMAIMAEKDDDPLKHDVLEDFVNLTRDGLPASLAIESATQRAELRDAVLESQKEFAASSEAGSQLQLAQALKKLSIFDILPNLRGGMENGWQEGHGVSAPSFGVHLNWAVSSALRLLWSREDIQAPKLEQGVAELNVVQAARDKAYNFERAAASLSRYSDKMSQPGSMPGAEEIALYGRARQVNSYSAPVQAEAPVSSGTAVSTLQDLLSLSAQNSPLAQIAHLRLDEAEAGVRKSRQALNVDVGMGAGAVVLDSVFPSLVVTLENLGRQKEAAQVQRLGASLRQAKSLFELTNSALQYANDYLYALIKLDAAEADLKAALGQDAAAQQKAQTVRTDAVYLVRRVEAELHRLLGGAVVLPSRAALTEIFSVNKDQFYWGNPLFKQFNLDATLNEAGQRVYEDLVETQKAFASVPELRLYGTSLLALVLAPAMPWMNVLLLIDAARTGLPLLSRLLSDHLPGKAKKEREARLEDFYAQLLENQRAAQALNADYVRQRDELKALARALPENPNTPEQAHEGNRWRIAALAYEIAPGAEDFLADRITDLTEAGRLQEAAQLWRSSHAREKLESGGQSSRAGELLRQKLNADEKFKKKLARRILGSKDWFEAKTLFDPWVEDFHLDFGPKWGGKILRQMIKKGYVSFYEKKLKDAPEQPLIAQLKQAASKKDFCAAYELYKKQFETTLSSATATAGTDAPRPLALRISSLMRSGQNDAARDLLAAAAEQYGGAGLDFEKHYPGLKAQVTAGTFSQEAAVQAVRSGLRTKLDLPSWEDAGSRNVGRSSVRVEAPRRRWNLVPDWDFASRWSNVSISETIVDREHNMSQTLATMHEESQGAPRENRLYSFSGAMGPLGEMRFAANEAFNMTRQDLWNPLGHITPISSTPFGDSGYSVALTQRSLIPGYDLSEKAVHRMFFNGGQRSEYSLGVAGLFRGSYNVAEGTLIDDRNVLGPGTGSSRHFRSYGRLGAGGEVDKLSSALRWDMDDLYGYRPKQFSGEFNLSGRYQAELLKNRETDMFWSGTQYQNRGYHLTGRYYADTYSKDILAYSPTDSNGVPRTQGEAGYAGLRQLLVAGKYGGIGMGYAAQRDSGARAEQYRSVSYLLPAEHGQIDVINSDDRSVGPAALQAQTVAGPVLARMGVDASSYTAVLGVRDPSGSLSATGRLAMATEKSHSRAWGAGLAAADSSYQGLWADHGHDIYVSISQGDWWGGDGLGFDYRRSRYSRGERYRVKMALSNMVQPSSWEKFVPGAPLFHQLYRATADALGGLKQKTKDQIAEDLNAAPNRQELAAKSAGLMKDAASRIQKEENSLHSSALLFNDAASNMASVQEDMRRQGITPIPYTWKPAFQEFLDGLDSLIIQLRQAQDAALWERSERLENAWFAWTPKVVDLLSDVRDKYEAYRVAYREQIWAITVSGGIDKRPEEIASFNKSSQWFVDYVQSMKNEFLEMQRISKMSDKEIREELSKIYRLREESRGDATALPTAKALRFLGPSSWLPTSTDIPVIVLESRANRLLAERQRRDARQARTENRRARLAGQKQE